MTCHPEGDDLREQQVSGTFPKATPSRRFGGHRRTKKNPRERGLEGGDDAGCGQAGPDAGPVAGGPVVCPTGAAARSSASAFARSSASMAA